jgi:hypothetical protein
MKLLKPVLSVAVVCTLLLAAGCDKDPEPVVLLVGKWTVTGGVTKITPSKDAFITYLIGLGFDRPDAEDAAADLENNTAVEPIDGTFEFQGDGTYEATDGGDTATGKWELSPDGITLTTDKGTPGEQVSVINKINGSDLELDFDLSGDIGIPASSGLGYHLIVTMKRI